MKQLIVWSLLSLTIAAGADTQNYHAVNGSSYAGSLGVSNNPAAMVNTPYKWDFTLFGLQETNSTNAVSIWNFSYLTGPADSKFYFSGGNYERAAKVNLNLNL
ncbi:MAG: hypothetical protein JST39_22075, partial [Bacteroidetes bacterium]|nr:hypothetical protein [Bacteroidota bacterium]